MKLILQIISFIALFAVIYVVILNGSETLTLQLWAPRYDEVAQTVYHTTKTFNLAFYTLGVLGVGLFVGVCAVVPFYLAQTEKLFAYKRELEKSSVKTDSSTSQVKVLQAKVEVLEKALKDALNNRY